MKIEGNNLSHWVYYTLVSIILCAIFATFDSTRAIFEKQRHEDIIQHKDTQITQLEQKVKALNQQIEELTLIECELYWIVKYEGEMEDVCKLLEKRVKNK